MTRRAGPSIVADRAGYYESAPDTGCQYAARCVECPWSECIKELGTRERREFTAAWRTIARWMAPADRALE